MRLRIEYADQNETFAAQLPRVGTVVARPRCGDSSLDWHLIHLDAAVSHEGASYTHLLIAARWSGFPIGAAEPTSVFILLVPSAQIAMADGFSARQFRLAAWGVCHLVQTDTAA